MKLTAQAIAGKGPRTAMVSLPMPPFPAVVKVDGADAVQAVPLGEWPARLMANPNTVWPWPECERVPVKAYGNAPRRRLVYARFPAAAPDEMTVEVVPGETVAHEVGVPVTITVVAGEERYHHRDSAIYHYVKREDSAVVTGFGATFTIRLAFQVGEEMRHWQWVEAIPVWDGPLSKAVVVGGHLYAGETDRPLTMAESARFAETPFYKEATICAKAFIVAHADGAVEMTAHFATVQGYGPGCSVAGLPVIEVAASEPLSDGFLRVAEGAVERSGDRRRVCWKPVSDPKIFLGYRKNAETGEFANEYAAGSETHFLKGVARSASCAMGLAGVPEPPRRFLASPEWYKRCAEFGIALPEESAEGFETLQQLSDAVEPVFLRNIHGEGMSRGGVYRYLDLPDERHELSMDGNESAFLFRGAYMRTSPALYHAALEEARHIADICVDHCYFNVHYHGDTPQWELFSQIYLRFGGLVNAWLETGDPWYLENAEGVANRWIAINRINQPRKNMGRDTEPVEGVMQLYDATGKDHYFQACERIALDVARSLWPDGDWRSGFGVGPYWGINALQGTPWNGSHLLAGIEEFLARATPETSAVYGELLEAARRLTRRLLKKVRDDCGGFHRATGAFLPRRHFLVAWLAADDELMAEIVDAVRRLEAEYEKGGEGFYRTGHHCGGYVDSPYVLLGLHGRTSRT